MSNAIDRSAGRAARVADILHQARRIFIEQGFSGASMSAVAARVGGSKATLYNYFPSKKALFTAVVEQECERKFRAIFEEWDLDSSDFTVTLRRFADRYVRVVLDEDNMIFTRLLIAESSRYPHLGEIFYKYGPRRGHALMVDYVKSSIRGGLVQIDDPSRFVQQFSDLCLADVLLKRLMNIDVQSIDGVI